MRQQWLDSCYQPRNVVRLAHRTVLARVFACCLLAFALSPVTAPFTTCDLADFAQSHPADTSHHPGRQMAVPHVRGTTHVVTMALTLAPDVAGLASDGRHAQAPTSESVHTRHDLRSVLRL